MSATVCPRCKVENRSGQDFCQGCGYGLDRTGTLSGIGRRPAEEWLGKVINEKYRVVAILGEGGFGTVFKAEMLLFEDRKAFALKLLHPDLCENERFRRRFLREAGMAMELVHPNAIQVREFGQTPEGLLYFTMDFCSGESLKEVLAREGFLTINRAVPLVTQILSVLEAAHDREIIHRDLKPENIFIVRDPVSAEQALVGDFGLAKSIDRGVNRSSPSSDLTKGGIVGTPKYMSPEQARGEPLDGRSDLYSVGVMFFEMITGQLPPRLETRGRLPGFATVGQVESPALQRLRELIPPNLVVPRRVLEVVARALEPRPAQRFQSAAEFREALAALPTYTPTYMDTSKPRHRRRGLVGASAVALAVLGLAGWLALDDGARLALRARVGEWASVTQPMDDDRSGGTRASAQPSAGNGMEVGNRTGLPERGATAPEPVASDLASPELSDPELSELNQAPPDGVVQPAGGSAETGAWRPAVLRHGARLIDWVPYEVGDELRYRRRTFAADGSGVLAEEIETFRVLSEDPERGLEVADSRNLGAGSWWWSITEAEFTRTRLEPDAAGSERVLTESVLRWSPAGPEPHWEHGGWRYQVLPGLQTVRLGGELQSDCLVVQASKLDVEQRVVERRTVLHPRLGEMQYQVRIDGRLVLDRQVVQRTEPHAD